MVQKSLSRGYLLKSGNDTIDPYPLIPRETAKILCITLKTFTEISQSFNAFRNFIKPAVPQKCIEPKYPPEPKMNPRQPKKPKKSRAFPEKISGAGRKETKNK